jgi:hypothetical protein
MSSTAAAQRMNSTYKGGGGLAATASSNLLAVDVNKVLRVFIKCTSIVNSTEWNDTHRPNAAKGQLDPHGMMFLKNPFPVNEVIIRDECNGTGNRAISKTLANFVHVIDSLMCMTHDLVVTSSSSELQSWTSLRECLEKAEAFPSHSFIEQTARWTQARLEEKQRFRR